MTVSVKLTLAAPLEYEAVNCFNALSENHCFFQNFKPDTTFGHRQLDVALQKPFETWGNFDISVRADVLNVFNHENVAAYDVYRGSPGVASATHGNPTAYLQPTRTFELPFSVGWQ